MGLRSLMRRTEERASQVWWNDAGIPGLISSAAYGNSPNVDQVLVNAGTWACVDVLTDGMARAPWDAVRLRGKIREPVMPTPVLLGAPSSLVTVNTWKKQLAFEMVTDGNAFALVTEASSGYPTKVEVLASKDVMERKVVNGVAQVKYDDDVHKLWPLGDMWHVPGRMVRGGSPFGLSPAQYSSKAIRMSIDALSYGAKYFGEDSMPAAVITSDQDLTLEQAQSAKDMVNRLRWGGETAVMGSGATLSSIMADPQRTQFLDVMRFAVEEACRFWRVPPAMAFLALAGQHVTYVNAAMGDVHFLKHTLDGYFVNLEDAISACLPRPQRMKVNRDAILSMDPVTRSEVQDRRLKNKTTSVNEVREQEDEPPFPGDEFNQPGIPGEPAPALVPTPTTEQTVPKGQE